LTPLIFTDDTDSSGLFSVLANRRSLSSVGSVVRFKGRCSRTRKSYGTGNMLKARMIRLSLRGYWSGPIPNTLPRGLRGSPWTWLGEPAATHFGWLERAGG